MNTRAMLVVSAALALGVGAVSAVEITPVPPQATRRIATVQVRVAPERPDWTYAVGEPARFLVSVTADNQPLEGAVVTYSVGPERMPAEKRTLAVPRAGAIIDGGTMREPGFLRCVVETEVAGRAYRSVATAAFSPEKLTPWQTEPEDFDAFWEKGRAALAKIPLEARLTLLPEACTDKVDVYHVSFRNLPNPWGGKTQVYGILCEPKAPGKYPAILRLPGAGVRPYTGDRDTAARGAITLQIGIHGIPVNLPPAVYDELNVGALFRYQRFNLDDREAYYYRRVVLGCLRANDFLVSRPAWDGKHLIASGASQGGWLALATTALDRRVTGLTVMHPGMCDMTADFHGRAGGWPRPFSPDEKAENSAAKIATTTYYDGVNFARRIKVPGFYTWGFNDEVCAPTSIYAAYNLITAPKELGLTLELGHAYTSEQWDAVQDWIARATGLGR
jgi:cephalosporin-C deacetylase